MDFSHLSILTVGDVMLDRFVHGEIERISPEAPVPVLRLDQTREMAGGAGNVVANLASLGANAVLVGICGSDPAGIRLRRLLEKNPRISAPLVESEERPTITKTRFIAERQQVVRTDRVSRAPTSQAEEMALIKTIDEVLPTVDAVILSDYGKGVLTRSVLAHTIALARSLEKPVFVDPKTADYERYRGVTCITPNLRELSAVTGAPVPNLRADIEVAARKLIAAGYAQAILVTRSERGMTLVEEGQPPTTAAARAREVFDVSGAGDTVIASLALAYASGRPLAQAMHIANAAAGVAVSKLGTATVDIAEVMHELAAQDTARGIAPTTGLLTLEKAQKLIAHWNNQGFRVGFTNGCFDILHPGHVALLAFARVHCDRLIVALNTDASVRRLKGETRPVNSLENRAQVLAAIRHVDAVVSFDEDTPLELITQLQPFVLIKGADYTVETVVGADVVLAAGGRVVLAELVEGQSTTNIITRMRETA